MSGIAGVYFLNGKPVSTETLIAMNRRLAHRGSDGLGEWAKGSVGLAHQKLNVVPEAAAETYPMISVDGQLVLTADARIDNRESLSRELGFDAALSDGALILEAYRRWGTNCAEKLIGDFAFALWDTPNKTLFLGRDRFGAKPLYFYASRECFVFASEIKALFCVEGVPRRLNETMMADYLMWSCEDKEITFYKDVERLTPAHTLTVSPSGISKKQYWSLDPKKEIRLKNDAEYAEAFREIFTEAVRCRLRSAFPVSSLLSGGLDSSSIACVARKIKPIHTFSAVFENVPQTDESEFIRTVTGLDGITPHLIAADQIPPFDQIGRVFEQLDEANTCNLAFLWGGVYPEANKHGVRVVLDGDGGDEVSCRGYPYLAELAGAGRFVELWKSASALSKNIGRPVNEILWHKAFRPHFPEWSHWAWRYLRWGGRPLWFDDTLLNPDFVKRLRVKERSGAQLGYEMRPARTVREDQYTELTSGAIAYSLEFVNRASSAYGIEQRYPYFDSRLVEFCLSLPASQKLHRGWTRMIVRRAMEGILPEEIRWRGGKKYMDSNMAYGLLKYEKTLLDRRLVENTQAIEPYVDVAALQKTYASFLEKPDPDSTTLVWQVALLSIWLEQSALAP